MSTSPTRRDTLAQHVASMRGTIDQIVGIDAETVVADIDSSIRERVSGPRFLDRFAMKRARKIAGGDLFTRTSVDSDSRLLDGGVDAVENLSVTVGAQILWREIIRLVRRSDLEALEVETHLAVRDIAMRGRSAEIDVSSFFSSEEFPDLQDRIRREGALSWACWLASRDPISARRLRVFTPVTMTRLLPKALPKEPFDREKRRLVVETEIDTMMTPGADEPAIREVA